ncbi:MAG: relaxase, partial [Coriobacteriales bacterium]
MTFIKPISGHTRLGGARRYLERDGRALAEDYLNMEAPIVGRSEAGMPVTETIPWDEIMDRTREECGNDTPWRGKPARTYKHYVLSPDPKDAITLDLLRRLSVR